ncbi:MAG: hypothetical protein RMJ59_02740 [Candidatus Nitrosocaldus sp.]|nr:hypothetical protein [Candidatus Nitrosocaldus sp.]MDW8275286.1 hypothetical protein [Candidatus Nitrosocaldus sp.]
MLGEEGGEQQQESREQEQMLIKRFEELVAKYGKSENLKMFIYFHKPGSSVKHPADVADNIIYVLDGKRVKVRCRCGASLDLTDYSKMDKVD